MEEFSSDTARTLALPRLVGARSAVRALLAELGAIAGEDVVLNARDLRSASPSSADEFVKAILVEGGSRSLKVVGSGSDFIRDLEASAVLRGVSDRLMTPLLK